MMVRLGDDRRAADGECNLCVAVPVHDPYYLHVTFGAFSNRAKDRIGMECQRDPMEAPRGHADSPLPHTS